MPTVRRYTRQVDLAPLPGARLRSAATPESMGANVALAQGNLEATKAEGQAKVWGQVAQFGNTVSRLGQGLYTEIVAKQRKDADDAALLEANNQLADWKRSTLYDPQRGAFTVRGKDAAALPDQVSESFNRRADDIRDGLSTPEQKAAWAQIRSQQWDRVSMEVLRHTSAQMDAFHADQADASIKNNVDDAVHHFTDPTLFGASLHDATSVAERFGQSQGWAPEVIHAKVAAIKSDAYVGAITNLLANDQTSAARSWFEAFKPDIAGDKLDNLQVAIDQGSVRKDAQKAADVITAAGGTLDTQRAKAKAIEDPKTRDQALEYIEHDWNVNAAARRAQDEATLTEAFILLDQTHGDMRAVQALQAWSDPNGPFDGPARASLKSYAKGLTTRQEADPETSSTARYLLMQLADMPPDPDHPEKDFVNLKLLRYRGSLTTSDFNYLSDLQKSARTHNQAELDKALVPHATRTQMFDHSLDELNIKSSTPEAGRIWREFTRRLDNWEALPENKGRQAPTDFMQKTMDSLVGNVVLRPAEGMGGWFGFGTPEVSKPATNVRLADIPAADRTKIEAKLKAKGQPASEANILLAYLLQKRYESEIK